MTATSSGLLDTSVFIARETGRPLGELPEHVALPVITIGELQLGVLNAADALIAATAIEHGLPVVTRDNDYDRIAAAHPPLRVLKV